MKVLNFNYDINLGFCWIEVETASGMGMWTVQCCLASDGAIPIKYTPQINLNDNGCDWGLCGEVNDAAFTYWGQNRCMTALLKSAENAGLAIVK